MSKMHHDDSSDLKMVAEVLKTVYGVRDIVLFTYEIILLGFRDLSLKAIWYRLQLVDSVYTHAVADP